MILGILFIILAFRLKVRAVWFGRFYYLWNVFLTAAAFAWITDTNMALNILEGRENTFLTLTLSSHVPTDSGRVSSGAAGNPSGSVPAEVARYQKGVRGRVLSDRTRTADRGIGKRTILAFVLILTAIRR